MNHVKNIYPDVNQRMYLLKLKLLYLNTEMAIENRRKKMTDEEVELLWKQFDSLWEELEAIEDKLDDHAQFIDSKL